MVRKLNVSLLSTDEVDYAFPLIRTAWPAAEIEAWRRFATDRIRSGQEKGTGILIVRNEQDCVAGVAAFRLTDDLLHGKVLVADPFCALDFIGQANVARALENGLEKVARRHDCAAIHVNLTSHGGEGGDDWLSSVLYERGHRIEGLQMCKLIPLLT